MFADRQPWLDAKVKQLNERGIAQLERFRKILPAIKRETAKKKLTQSLIDEVIPLVTDAFREQIGDWEMKGSDAKKMMDAVVEITVAAKSGGVEGVLDCIDKNTQALISVRRELDRGSRENIPIWKVLTIIAIFAIWMLTIFIAAFTSGDTQLVIFLVGEALAIAGFVALILFC